MEDQKKHVIDTLKQATNILVTVKRDPNLDQLSACIALTLLLNNIGKHATAVFSGRVPSVLEFLEPAKTIQTNTDSLQDFIISLDKSKADKLRYKVEDTVVKIFITPYRVSLSEKDLQFGQGDFNVDAVVALGVHSQDDVDQAITAHGRILHDATVISVNTTPGVADDLGSINWIDAEVSSLSELLANATDDLVEERGELLDNQIATALLTGIVAETERFGNAKTRPATLQTAARLLQAGANQELVADKLSGPEPPMIPPAPPADNPGGPMLDQADLATDAPEQLAPAAADGSHTNDDGSLSIGHRDDDTPGDQPEVKEVHHGLMPDAVTAEPKSATYDPNQISVPASVRLPVAGEEVQASANAPLSNPADDAAREAEEQAVLDMLQQSQPEPKERTTIQPLRDQNGFVAEPPLHDKKSEATDGGGPVDTSLDPAKFAVTPPTMGGTLTAAHDQSLGEPPADPLESVQPRQAMLSHGVQSIAAPASDTTAASPAADSSGEVPPIIPANPDTGYAGHEGQTLAELETVMHSPHVTAETSDTPEDNNAARQALEAVMAAHDAMAVDPQSAVAAAPHLNTANASVSADGTMTMPMPSMPVADNVPAGDQAMAGSKPSPAPPVPPPFPAAPAS